MLIHKLLNKDPYILPEEEPLIILDRKYDVRMDKNGKYTKYNRRVARRVHFVING